MSAGKASPITPAVLAWAVAEDGRPLEQIAAAVGVDTDALDAWMHGEAKPIVGQVTKIAAVLKRPRSMFFLPAAPDATSLPPDFRHPPGDERQVSPASRRRVRQARQMQLVLGEALADQPPVEVPTFSMASVRPDVAAGEIRDWLGISVQEQSVWKSDYEALASWRRAIESRGIFVFSLEIGERRQRNRPQVAGTVSGTHVRGFSAWDDHAPMIVMNSSRVNAAARIFTMGHEMGHLTTRLDAACIDTPIGPSFSEPVERWCEEFGAALLMPEDPVRRWAAWRGVGQPATIDDISAMTRAFRTSARACALRLIDLDLADRSLYAAVERVFRPIDPPADPAKKMASDPRSVLRLRQFGPRALETVFREVPPIEALSLLRITVPDARDLAAQVPSAAAI